MKPSNITLDIRNWKNTDVTCAPSFSVSDFGGLHVAYEYSQDAPKTYTIQTQEA